MSSALQGASATTSSNPLQSPSKPQNPPKSPATPQKLLSKKTSRDINKKQNRELCSICRDGGNLILCDHCPRSFHPECLKIKEDQIPEGSWYCPICLPKMQKKLEKQRNGVEDQERERKRLIKNQKRRLWRLKRKQLNESKKNTVKNNILVNKDGNALIDSFLVKNGKKNYIELTTNNSKNMELKNSMLSMNLTYSLNNPEQTTKCLSLPILFPMPNDLSVYSNDVLKEIDSSLKKNIRVNRAVELFMNEKYKNKEDFKEYLNKYNSSLQNSLKNFDAKNDKIISNELSKLLSTPNSIEELNKLSKNSEDKLKYNVLLREYWNTVLKKQTTNSKHVIKYPIDDKELYSFPDIYGLEKECLNKPKGKLIKYCNGSDFTKLISIYDFLSSFSNNIFLSKFTIEDLYCALKESNNYTKSEISLLSFIHLSLLYLLISELITEQQVSEISQTDTNEMTLLKIIIDTMADDTKLLYKFIFQTWPELIRILLLSYTYNKELEEVEEDYKPIMDKLDEIKDTISYNQTFSFKEKLLILEKLVYYCYSTNFIRKIIKESLETKEDLKRSEKDLEDSLREVEMKKKELERQEQFTQPQSKIDELNNKLNTLGEDHQELSRYELSKLRKSIEKERNDFKNIITQLNNTNKERDDLLQKIEKIKQEIFEIPAVGKKCIGIDGRKYKYFYFPWMNNKIFIRIEKSTIESNDKYQWRVIDDEETIKELIETLSDKGKHESNLKKKIKRIYPKRMGYYAKNMKNTGEEVPTNNNANSSEEDINTLEIFNTSVLAYENLRNPLKNSKKDKLTFLSQDTNQYDLVIARINKLEENITNYLGIDHKQYESHTNRENLKAWLTYTSDLEQYSRLLLFFNERVKSPYKNDENDIKFLDLTDPKKANIIDDEIEMQEPIKDNSPVDSDGKLNPYYINRSLVFAGKAKLWSKDFEYYKLEDKFKFYLNMKMNFPKIYISIELFEIVLNDLVKRREFYKKRNEELIGVIKEDKINLDEYSSYKDDASYSDSNEKRKTLRKRKKANNWKDHCMHCGQLGDLVCCEDCPNVSHLSCAGLKTVPDVWRCSECLFKLNNKRVTRSAYNKYQNK